jgi:hypothetical protein
VNNPRRADAWAALLLAVASIAVAMAAMRSFRASGAQPFFYQENFQRASRRFDDGAGAVERIVGVPLSHRRRLLASVRHDVDIA